MSDTLRAALEEAKQRADAASEGPWIHKLDPAWDNKDRIIESPDGFVIVRDENCDAHFKLGRDDEKNWDFIAAARLEHPALIEFALAVQPMLEYGRHIDGSEMDPLYVQALTARDKLAAALGVKDSEPAGANSNPCITDNGSGGASL